MKRFIKHLKNRKGITIIMVALMLFLLLALLGMAVDIAYMYFTKNQLQVAADAAALAGSGKLNGVTNDTVQSEARNEAILFSNKNKAAGVAVQLASSGNNELNDANDITVGNWDPNLNPKYLAERIPVNAVQVRTRRTSGSPLGPVNTFLGKVFTWNLMNASSIAIAARLPRPTSGIVICDTTCNTFNNLVTELNPLIIDFQIQQKNSPYGVAWTEFDQESPQTPLSCLVSPPSACIVSPTCGEQPNELVAAYIWQRKIAPYGCVSIRCNNGAWANMIRNLECAFRSTTFDTGNKTINGGIVQKWTVTVPVIAGDCPVCNEPNPLPVLQFAEIDITNISDVSKTITTTRLHCFNCGDYSELGSKSILVQ